MPVVVVSPLIPTVIARRQPDCCFSSSISRFGLVLSACRSMFSANGEVSVHMRHLFKNDETGFFGLFFVIDGFQTIAVFLLHSKKKSLIV